MHMKMVFAQPVLKLFPGSVYIFSMILLRVYESVTYIHFNDNKVYFILDLILVTINDNPFT